MALGWVEEQGKRAEWRRVSHGDTGTFWRQDNGGDLVKGVAPEAGN